ncbi:MAG TPA: tyrosine-type recombinase/integrase [Candidatus Paceibacterota bacterium]|nr:tyrosine-type recombinase/integrase [Candidatus Paceibacterota bacterium]
MNMKARYRLFLRRKSVYYAFDDTTKTFTSLKTKDKAEAARLLMAMNEAGQQPAMNLSLARVYLRHSDPMVSTRTWQHVFEEIIAIKNGPTQARWISAKKDKAFDLIRNRILIETQAEHLLAVLSAGTVSTNAFLRKVHNFAVDMNWLPATVIPRRQWPAIHYKEKRAISLDEHRRIIAAEVNPERKTFYQLCWHLGASQGDIAVLKGEDVDWQNGTVSFFRRKTGAPVLVHLGKEALNLLKDLPSEGPLFPYLSSVRAGDRATEFASRCSQLDIKGVTLHSYRYAWAERAKSVGMPERFAMENLGHNSKAVHRAYAKRALMKIPSLEDYEQRAAAKIEQAA